MCDQRLVGVQFQREVVAQEPCQLVFDGLGFGLRSDEPQEMIVCLCRPPDYAECGGRGAGQRRLMRVVGRHNSGL